MQKQFDESPYNLAFNSRRFDVDRCNNIGYRLTILSYCDSIGQCERGTGT